MSSNRGDYPSVRKYSIDGKEIRASSKMAIPRRTAAWVNRMAKPRDYSHSGSRRHRGHLGRNEQ